MLYYYINIMNVVIMYYIIFVFVAKSLAGPIQGSFEGPAAPQGSPKGTKWPLAGPFKG